MFSWWNGGIARLPKESCLPTINPIIENELTVHVSFQIKALTLRIYFVNVKNRHEQRAKPTESNWVWYSHIVKSCMTFGQTQNRFMLPMICYIRCHFRSTFTKTRLCNFDPLKPHFYIVKLGFTGAHIIFLNSAHNIDCGYSLEPPR